MNEGEQMSDTLQLRDVLLRCNNMRWSDGLYMNKHQMWVLGMPCIVHDVDDIEDDELDLPNVAIDLGFDYILSIQDVQGIVANARAQKADVSESQLLDAIKFYHQNDAYIEF